MAVTRIGDVDVTHCSVMTRAQGSSDVFVNGIGVSRQGDNNTTHLLPNIPPCGMLQLVLCRINKVFVNGKGCGRVGDR